MTLRRSSSGFSARHNGKATEKSVSLRWQLSLLSATLVAVIVGIITVAAYWSVSNFTTEDVDNELEQIADTLLERSQEPGFYATVDTEIAVISEYHPGIRIALTPSGWEYVVGDGIAYPRSLTEGFSENDKHIVSSNSERFLAKRDDSGTLVVLAKEMGETDRQLNVMAVVLLLIGACGVVASIFLGFLIAHAGIKPLGRLQRAVEEIVRTDELRVIPVIGNDEFARLTQSFNEMLEALRESRTRQSQLVADAGHELRTPLTSMRTNIELLMMASTNLNQNIPESDLEDLRRDVMAQMEEMSSLIGDLVDLARERSREVTETINVKNVLDVALNRMESRKFSVKIEVSESIDWFMDGDTLSMTRALVNVLDNAIKWSPENGVVQVKFCQTAPYAARLTIDDSGPGIPENERELVFERFYRSVNSRSMPGSGLGLAIVDQVIQSHHGDLVVAESEDGGTRIIIDLPGEPATSSLENGDD